MSTDRRAILRGFKPGSPIVTQEEGARGWTEKLLLWPVRADGDRSVWLVETAHGAYGEEAVTSWKRIRNISVEYPTDFRGKVAQFADALEDNQLREKIQRGRAEAKRLLARYSIPDQL